MRFRHRKPETENASKNGGIPQKFTMARADEDSASRTAVTSCGTLVLNRRGEILLCHATGTNHWDIPKGLQSPGESPLQTARRELWEETGLDFDDAMFEDLGCFDYRKGKRLHLYKLAAPPDLDSLAHLRCSSCFPHRITGEPTPEMDGYQWAARSEIRRLCATRMAERLLALDNIVWQQHRLQ